MSKPRFEIFAEGITGGFPAPSTSATAPGSSSRFKELRAVMSAAAEPPDEPRNIQSFRDPQPQQDSRPEGRQPPPEAIPLLSIRHEEPNPEDTLLGDRFLCREGGMLFVGPSGIGKSSASVQMDVCWSIGKPAFGIHPARPLKILQIQAENDRGDLVEMIRGVWGAMGFDADAERICLQNLLTASEKTRTGALFLQDVVRPLLERHRPDILRIDPLLAYLGDDPTDMKALAAFCRHGLNPLLEEFRCAVILNHHTPKTTNRDTTLWRASDWMYSGAGGADLTNWARAIIVIEPTTNPAAFKFIGAKRTKRLQWSNEQGETEFQRLFCHSENSIAWRDATEAEVEGVRPKNGKAEASEEELISFVPISGSLPKDELLARWNKKGIGEKKCRSLLSLMLADGKVFEWRIARSGTRPAIYISRHEQTLV
jgi:hypothetical protein